MGFIYDAFKKIAYKAIDVITLGNGVPVTINNFKLKLPTKYFRMFPKDYEASSFSFFKKHLKQGDTVIDIGAHIGLYSVFFAKQTNGKVYSFEPTPDTASVLRETIKINHCKKNVTVVQAAVSEKPGLATFYTDDADVHTGNSLVALDLGSDSKRKGAYQVPVTSVDQVRMENNLTIDFLKIDAEGVELDVLKGARNTFLTDRPKGILGLHPFAYTNKQETLSAIWELLHEYKLQVQADGKTISKEQFCNRDEWVYDVEFLPG